MPFNQNNQGKQNEQTAKFADAAKANLNKTADHAAKAAETARAGINTMTDIHEQAAATSKKLLQDGVETASKQAREASDRLARSLGFSGQDAEGLAQQSKQNLEAVTRCGTVMTQALQDASRSWFELAQKQWQRNLDGMNKLTRSTSVQEFATIQSNLVREGLQQLVQDSRAIAETSLRAVEEASKAFPSVPQQSTPETDEARNAA